MKLNKLELRLVYVLVEERVLSGDDFWAWSVGASKIENIELKQPISSQMVKNWGNRKKNKDMLSKLAERIDAGEDLRDEIRELYENAPDVESLESQYKVIIGDSKIRKNKKSKKTEFKPKSMLNEYKEDLIDFLVNERKRNKGRFWSWQAAADKFGFKMQDVKSWGNRVAIKRKLDQALEEPQDEKYINQRAVNKDYINKDTEKEFKKTKTQNTKGKNTVQDRVHLKRKEEPSVSLEGDHMQDGLRDGILDTEMSFKGNDINVNLEIEEQLLKGGEINEMRILELLNLNVDTWTVKSSSVRRSTWEAQTPEGIKILNSLRISANVKLRDDIGMSYFTERLYPLAIKTMFETVGDVEENKEVEPIITSTGDNIAIVTIADLHLGKLAWGPETGANYDYKIAKKNFNYIIDEAVRKLRGQNIEKIVFFWSQDFFHYDHEMATTTAGTPQDTDVRWQKLFVEGVEMLKEAIIKLQYIAPVETFYTRSNHDTQVAYYALYTLSSFFKAAKQYRVCIEESPSPRKYMRYGVNLFGFAHGDKERKRISEMMSIEGAHLWDRRQYREFFLGHYHHQIVKEVNGVILRYLSSPSGTDSWHNDSGFIGNFAVAQVFIRNKHRGPVAQLEIPLWVDYQDNTTVGLNNNLINA